MICNASAVSDLHTSSTKMTQGARLCAMGNNIPDKPITKHTRRKHQPYPTSSTKMTQGASLCATPNSALTYFSASPNHLEAMEDTDTAMKLAPAGRGAAFVQEFRYRIHYWVTGGLTGNNR